MSAGRRLLVLDTASPRVSVAAGTADSLAASRTLDLHRSSELLLSAVEEVLDEAGWRLRELDGVAALRGPGSFTGLRIGLATVLGWHQALGLAATAVSTLDVLAVAAEPGNGEVVAAVDALRGDWYTRRYRSGRGMGEATLVAGRDLVAGAPCRLVGFGISALAAEPWWDEDLGAELVEPPPLAAEALAVAALARWDPELLTAPIYFRPPAVTPPAGKGGKA